MKGNVDGYACVVAVGYGQANRNGVADCWVYREKFLSHKKKSGSGVKKTDVMKWSLIVKYT